MRMKRWGWLCLALMGCAANTDLTVRPATTIHPSFKVEVPAASSDGRLPGWQRPRAYKLSLELDPATKRFRGRVLIDITLSKPTGALVMHAAQLDIRRALVRVNGRRLGAEVTFRKAAGARAEREELVLVTSSEMPAGDIRVELEYSAPLEEKLHGVYRVKAAEQWYAFTQFEPSDARRMFPGFDDPSYKVPFEVDVLVPKGNVVLSNAPEKEHRDEGGRVHYFFERSQPMPSYLLALAIGPFEFLQGPAGAAVPLRVATVPGKAKNGKLALKAAAEHMAIMAEYYDRPYPYKKLDLVAVPNFGPGAMENAGLITFREELLLADEATASARAKRSIAVVVAHELAHQWFGNLVTMAWWDDLWLNEGFASYMEVLVVDRWRPKMRAGLELLSDTGRVMNFDALSSARAVRQPVRNTHQAAEAFDGITYVKGASVIKMLHHWLGPDAFRAGVRNYIRKHAWGNARAADLFAALAETSKQDVAAVAATFLDQPGVPLVSAEVVCKAGASPQVTLSQRRYRARVASAGSSEDDPLWTVPVCVEYASSARANAKRQRSCTVLETRRSTLALAGKTCPAWLLPNAHYDGYYRYSMPIKQLAALGKATAGAGAVNKLGYLTNMWALVRAGDVPAATMFDTLTSMSGERERAVIEEQIIVLTSLSNAVVEAPARAKFERFVSRMLLPTARRLGWDSRPSDSEDMRLLRRSVLAALAVLTQDRWMSHEAMVRARKFVKAPASASADTLAIALRMAAHNNDEVVNYDTLLSLLRRVSSPGLRIAVVQALASLGDAAQLRRALSLVITGEIRKQDLVYVLRAASEWPDSRRVLIDWLERNLNTLSEQFPGFGTARMLGVLRRLCDAGARRKAAAAFSPMVAKMGSDRRLREALENADLCIDLRARQAKEVTKYLTQWR